MIELFSSGVKIRLDFSFFAVITLFLCFDTSGYGLMSIAACFLHECGHLTVMLLKKNGPEIIEFYGGGIRLRGAQPDVPVIIAGSIANFIIAAIVVALSDGTSIYPLIFAAINVIIGLFNMLPLGYLDGRKLIEHMLIKRFTPTAAIRILHIIEYITSLVLFVSVTLLFFFRLINFTVAIVLIYLFLLDIFSGI